MANLIEELEKLGALRDRGVLTQGEFDRQKALLLGNLGGSPTDPIPAAPTTATMQIGSFHGISDSGQPTPRPLASADFPDFPPPPAELPPGMPPFPQQSGGHNNALIIALVGGGVALVLLICVGLWAAGLFKRHTYSPPAYSSYTPPVATSTSGASSTVGDGGDNPLLGSWAPDLGQTASCPTLMEFKESSAIMTAANGTSTEVPMQYSVLSGQQIVMIAPDRPSARTTATISKERYGEYLTLSDGACHFHRIAV